MKTESLSIKIQAPQNAVLHYLADINNFAEWATEYCQEIKKEGAHYKVKSPMGEVYFRIHANENTGEIKYFASNEPNGSDYMASKVTQINDSSCEYMIDFSQPEGLTDEVYQQQCNAIKIELQNIRDNFVQHH